MCVKTLRGKAANGMTGSLLGIVIALTTLGMAAPDQSAGRIEGRSDTSPAVSQTPEQISKAVAAAAQPQAHRHVIVQFTGPVAAHDRAALAAAGVTLQSYLGGYSFFALVNPQALNPQAVADVASLSGVLAIERDRKLHPDLVNDIAHPWAIVDRKDNKEEGGLVPADPMVAAYILFHRDVDLDMTAAPLVQQNGGRIRSQLRSINGLVIELPMSMIKPLASEDAVQWIEPPLPKFSELNDSNRVITGANIVNAPPYGLDGSGVSVLVYDGGDALATHGDFGGRLTVRDSAGLSDHATHVSGTVGGSGAGSGGTFRGMAPGVTIESYGFEQEGGLQQGFLYTDPGDLEADYSQAINTFGVDIANNSIGTNTAPNGFPCSWEGDYGVTDVLIDTVVRGDGTIALFTTPFRVVWANGNERQVSTCQGSDPNFPAPYHTTAPPACAKNHITVGAMNSNDDSVTSFTSFGPSDDGRLKPDVSAPGCQSNGDSGVTSTSSSGGYNVKCGTSMASPTVCGLSALLLQDFRNFYPGEPDFRNSTLKVLLAHTAQDIQNTGPDYQSGYGSVRIQPAIDHMRSGNFLEASVDQGETFNALVVVNPGDPPLKVTLAWDDAPGMPTADHDPVLVNDLDLRVFDGASNQYFPWTLQPNNPSAPAVRTQPDHANNIEQVVIDAPAPGVYRLEVAGFNVPVGGPQVFSIAASPLLVNCSSTGVIALDRPKYPCESSADIRVVDCDLNTDDLVVETVNVTIVSDSEPAGETVTLMESGPETATFLNTITLSQTDAAGVLLVAAGDDLTATYVDADDGQGGTNVVVTAAAVVDCTPPVISTVQTTNIEPRSAMVTFATDELANGQVRYGLSCGALTETAGEGGYKTAHTFNLTDLEDDTTYLYAVDAADQAGNDASDDNGGSCYTFTTPAIPDFFTEEFGGDNDLDNRSLTFVPNGSFDYYAGCVESITALPTDPAGGINLSISDDGSATLNLASPVSLYGASDSTIYLNANGNITFDVSDGDYTESLTDHFDQPRVSALFDDLNPAQGGTISWKQLADRVAVTWQNVPEYNLPGTNTLQIELFLDGTIRFSYLAITASDGITGLSEGQGLSPDYFETDVSALGSCTPGDADGDGDVDLDDYQLFWPCMTGPDNGPPAIDCDVFDLNTDGDVDDDDFARFQNGFTN